jgi:C4-dicarboxylate transporter DctQ subunit
MKNLINFLDITVGLINRYIAVIGITSGVALAFVNVVARYGFNYSITWASELTVYLFLWSVFFGVAYCFKIDGHIVINLLVERVSKKVSKMMMVLTRIISIIFLGAVAYYGFEYLALVIDLDEQSVDLDIPMWIPYLVIPISFTFSAFRVAEHLAVLIKTPADKIEFTSETSDLLKEAKIDNILLV